MSEANVRLVKEGYAAFSRGDIPGLLDRLAEDVEWVLHAPRGAEPAGGSCRGKAAVADWFGVLGKNYEFQSFSPGEFFASGDKVVVLGHEAYTARPTGRRHEQDWAHVFTVRGGRIARFEAFYDSYSAAQLWR